MTVNIFKPLSKDKIGNLLVIEFILHMLQSAFILMLLSYTVILQNIIPPFQWIIPPVFGLASFKMIYGWIFYLHLDYWFSDCVHAYKHYSKAYQIDLIYMLLFAILNILYVLCKMSIIQDYHILYSVFIGIFAGIKLFLVFYGSFIFMLLGIQPKDVSPVWIINYFIITGETYLDQFLPIRNGIFPVDSISGRIQLPPEFCNLVTWTNDLVENVFLNILTSYKNHKWLTERAILAAKNKNVHGINNTILITIRDQAFIYKSVDTVLESNEAVDYPSEFFNSLDLPKFSLHVLQLKIGIPIILLQKY